MPATAYPMPTVGQRVMVLDAPYAHREVGTVTRAGRTLFDVALDCGGEVVVVQALGDRWEPVA